MARKFVTGEKELAAALDALPKNIRQRVLREGLNKVLAPHLEREVKREAPFDEGDLMASIHSGPGKGTPSQVVAGVTATDPKWHLIEFGHAIVNQAGTFGTVPARPFLRNTLAANEASLVDLLQKWVRQKLQSIADRATRRKR